VRERGASLALLPVFPTKTALRTLEPLPVSFELKLSTYGLHVKGSTSVHNRVSAKMACLA
jgi:hypothetical protein